MPAVEHRSRKGLNNRAEDSHLTLRKRERVMQGFRSVGGLHRFISMFSAVRNHFVPSATTLRPWHPQSSQLRQGAVKAVTRISLSSLVC